MKIYFDNVNFASTTGPNSFAKRLAHQLILRGHTFADVTDYDVALVFIEPSAKLDVNKPYVQRLDGIWFHPREYHSKNVGIKKAYDTTQYVIFQSDFDRRMIEHWWGVRKGSQIIHNGITLHQPDEIQIPYPIRQLRARYEYIFVSSANWHRQKRLQENVEFYRHLRSKPQYSNSCLIILGNHPDYKTADPHIFYGGSQNHETCLQIYTVADWMIDLEWLGHCPNVVVEAVSCGCAVVCSNSGGVAEIVRDGLVLPETQPYHYELVDYDNPPPLNYSTVDQLPTFSAPIRREHLDINFVAQKYEEILNRACNNN